MYKAQIGNGNEFPDEMRLRAKDGTAGREANRNGVWRPILQGSLIKLSKREGFQTGSMTSPLLFSLESPSGSMEARPKN